MKKFISVLCVLLIIVQCFSIPAFASDGNAIEVIGEKDNIVFYSDGNYTVTTVVIEETSIMATTKSIVKVASHYLSDGTEACRLTLSATFSINGSTVTCTGSSYLTNTYVSGWSIASPSSAKANHGSYAVATATGTAKKKTLGVTIKSVPLSVSATCYSNGTIS